MKESAVAECLEDRVTSFVAAERGLSPSSLDGSSKLQTDLGLDTVNAVIFFENFAEEFGVDIEGLKADWDRHFEPEGAHALFAPSVVGIIILSVVAAVAIQRFAPQIPLNLLTIVMPVGSILAFLYFWRKRHPIIPITVAHLVQAARSGRWQQIS